MPVRNIPKNYIHITGVVASPKAIGEAGFEGGLEFDHLRILAFDPAVARFEVQSHRIPWRDEKGRLHWYTLDCRVDYADGDVKSLLCETKPRATLKRKWKELRPRFRAAVHCATEEGSRFKLLTEREIRTAYLRSVLFLLPQVRRGADLKLQNTLLSALREVGESTPQKLLDGITQDLWIRAEYLPALWYLIGTFQIAADLDEPLTMNMRICLP